MAYVLTRELDVGMEGRDVEAWQTWLSKNGYPCGALDGDFGGKTQAATKKFQELNQLPVTGKLDPATFMKATQKYDFDPTVAAGIVPVPDVQVDKPVYVAPGKPVLPPFPQLSGTKRAQILGTFQWRPYPGKVPGQDIDVLGDWSSNIIKVKVPQLRGIPLYEVNSGQQFSGYVTIHKVCAPSLLGIFEDVEREGKLKLLRTYDGAYNPRYIRGSTTSLSNHAYGSAIDLNAYANGMNREPAKPGQDGCLYDLVPIFAAWGWYWGGFFSRMDGMHFEWACDRKPR